MPLKRRIVLAVGLSLIACHVREESEPDFLADSPFDSDAFESVVGFGGGTGGAFGTLTRTGTASPEPRSGESYAPVADSGFHRTDLEPLSTFSIDVDTASWSNVRGLLREGRLPPSDAVRIEEMLNAFRYDDPAPTGDEPFAVHAEVASCPWEPAHRLVRLGLHARELDLSSLPPANLVLLIDVSGSMDSPEKLPLLVDGLHMLVEHLNDRDRVAIVTYAGAADLALPSTSCAQRGVILDALSRLRAGGSTAGEQGIRTAYALARENRVEGGTNRVILATDGDFNVGISDRGALEACIREEARSGVFLSVLGFGQGHFADDRLETLADRGNGNYAYVDSLAEARRVLVEELGGTLVTVANDVKIQVEFNPLEVSAWRRIGYENRVLASSDFGDDTRDAGEIGAGHSLTVLLEIVPARTGEVGGPIDASLRYRTPVFPSAAALGGELLQVALRWKPPGASESVGASVSVKDGGQDVFASSDDFRFSSAVAAFGLLLRHSELHGQATFALVETLARSSLGADERGERREFLELVATARGLQPR